MKGRQPEGGGPSRVKRGHAEPAWQLRLTRSRADIPFGVQTHRRPLYAAFDFTAFTFFTANPVKVAFAAFS